MNILGLLGEGRAAPYVIYDLGAGFEAAGHKVKYISLKDELFPVLLQMNMNQFLEVLAGKMKELEIDMVYGYGAKPIIPCVDPSGTRYTVWDILEIPYLTIWYDSPTADYIFPSLIDIQPSKYHHMFIWDRYYFEDLGRLGFENIHYLPIGTNTKRFRRMQPTDATEVEKYGADVAFVGSYTARRELAIRMLMDFNPVIYGYDWEQAKSAAVRERLRGPADNFTELNKIYNYSKININVTVEQGLTSLNMRVFDVMAAGGFLISDFKEDFELLFDEEEFVCYRNLSELPELVEYYLKNPEERKKKAWAGRRRVLRDHDYTKRAEQIMEAMREAGLAN